MITATNRRLLEILGDWMQNEGPLYVRLTRAFASAIEQSDLPAGTKLPAERSLAQLLGVSRATITQTYESLRDAGWVQSRQGSGTWVGSPSQAGRHAGPAGPRPLSSGTFFTRITDSSSQPPINMSMAALSGADEMFTGDAAISLSDLLGVPSHGYAPLGFQPLRQEIARMYARAGIPTLPEEILVTTGAQQALSLLACHYIQRGDAVVVESPTYSGAIDAFSRAGARLIPVPVGRHGVRIDLLAEALASAKPRLVYLMPTFQNPTGAVIPAEAREQIARLADQSQVPFAEDNTLSDLAFGTEPPPPLAHYARGGTIVSIGSMSKLYWAGIRIGWVRGPESLITRLGQHKVAADLGSSMVSQVLACKLLPNHQEVKAKRAKMLTARLDLLEGLLHERIPEWRWQRPEGGLSLWVRITTGDANAFAQQALSHGVAITPGSDLAPDDAFQDHIRLNFVVDEALIEAAVDRLAAAWQAHRAAGGPQREAVEVKV
jgi:DNA-binding transcriptional MocR family regulator